MVAVRQAIRGAAQIFPEPATILNAADRALRSEQPDRIVTAFVGILDPVTLMLSYANAGHPWPYLITAEHEIVELRGDGLPLGLRESGPAGGSDAVTNIHPLDEPPMPVLYTDGLIEATHDILEGERRVISALREPSITRVEDPAHALLHSVLDAVCVDVAVMTMRVTDVINRVTRSDVDAQANARWSIDVHDRADAEKARLAIAAIMAERGANDNECSMTELVFSELIGNVVRHAGTTADVAIDFSGPFPVLHVLDCGPGFSYTARLPADVMSESGRGLFIVTALTHDFSVARRSDRGSHARAVLAFKLPARLPSLR